ncbi:MAG: hypothetical protein F4150_05025 [Chloroflexi bacterium]|nr:hypothetical protein [Chloroflexota bacterium]
MPAIPFQVGGVDLTPPPIDFSGVNPLNLRIAGEVADGLIAHPTFTAAYYRETPWPRIEEGSSVAAVAVTASRCARCRCSGSWMGV